MNSIAKWCQFKGYRDWCYIYRIPEEEEFVEGFEYERIVQIESTNIDYGTEKYIGIWKKCMVRDPKKYSKGYKPSEDEKWEDGIIKQIKLYLEDGFIRVPKSDESINNKEKNEIMKVYYFQVIKKELEVVESKIKGFGKTTINQKYKYVMEHGSTQKEAYDSIVNTFKIKDGGFGECQNILNLEGSSDTGYILSSGGDEITKKNINTLSIKYEDCLVADTAMYDFSELWPKNIEPTKNLGESIRPRLNVFSRLYEKIKKGIIEIVDGEEISTIFIKYQTIVDTINKYPSRLDPKTNVWKPVIKPELTQLPKSEKRLVCVAHKDKKISKRIPHNEAEILIKNHPEYEFISKEEYRRVQRPKSGLSFIPDNMDKKYKRIPIQIEYVEQEMIRNSYRDEKTGKMVYLPITYKDTDKTFTEWEYQLVYDDSADNKYHDYKKIPSNPSSSKVAKYTRKSKYHPQGVSGKKAYNTYKVSFFRNMVSGSAEFVYTQLAVNETQAIAKASNKLVKEGADLAYYSPKVELSIKGETNVKVRKENGYKRIILPLVTNLPEHKDRKGNVIPWTVKEFKFDPKTQKTELVNTEVKTFTGYQITYQKIESPFKKSPSKWKHPIKDNRSKVKVIKSKNNKTIIIKKK